MIVDHLAEIWTFSDVNFRKLFGNQELGPWRISTNRLGGSNREKMLQTLNGTSQNDKNTDQIYQNLQIQTDLPPLHKVPPLHEV